MNPINFHPPSWYADYQPPEMVQLLGDHHIEKGSIARLGGAGGVGKSLAVTSLAIAGATTGEWFGLKVHKKFKTMILQAENSNTRLKNEYVNHDIRQVDEWIRVSEPPERGFSFDSPEFRNHLRSESEKFSPDLVVLDPWNHIAKDDNIDSYNKALDRILEVYPVGENNPALLIVAHTRKPNPDRKPEGSNLMFEISGSHKLTTIARSVFVLVQVPDTSVIQAHCCKNNNGESGELGFWEYADGSYKPCCGNASKGDKKGITLEVIKDILVNPMKQSELVKRLQDETGKSQSTCYAALGTYDKHLEKVDNKIQLKVSEQ